MTNNQHFVLPPEWSEQEWVMLSWPHSHTDWNYMLDWVQECFGNIAQEIAKSAKVLIVAPDSNEVIKCIGPKIPKDRYSILEMPTNDTWARDFGFITTVNELGECRLNDFKFNGWGLKFAANFDNLISKKVIEQLGLPETAEYVNRLGFVLEGGAIDIDQHGNLLTTTQCLLSPNRNGDLWLNDIEERLMEYLGAKSVWWLRHGALQGDDTDSHVDTLARFLPDDIIAYASCDRNDDPHYYELDMMRGELEELNNKFGNAKRLIDLPIPNPIYDSDGNRLPATYANFLLINQNLLLPIYNDEHYDKIAIERLKEALPSWTIIPIDCRALIQQHGSLHCVTMQIPANALQQPR